MTKEEAYKILKDYLHGNKSEKLDNAIYLAVDMLERNLEQEEETFNPHKMTKEFLDSIDLWNEFLVDSRKSRETLGDLMERIELMYGRTIEVQASVVFEGYVFNHWDENDFREYLEDRYKDNIDFYEETNTYYQLI